MTKSKIATIGGHKYSIGRLPVLGQRAGEPNQLDLSRRVMPIYQKLEPEALKRLGSLYSEIPEAADEDTKKQLRIMCSSRVFGEYLTIAASAFSDADFRLISHWCLSLCERVDNGLGLGKVMTSDGVLAFDDIDANNVLALIYEVLAENLGSFFRKSEPQ